MPSRPCVVLTREPSDNRGLMGHLRSLGVPCREIPCTRTVLLGGGTVPEGAAAVAFSSRRAVRGFSTELCSLLQGENPPLVASVGPATTEELAQRHHRVDLEAQPHTGRALAELLDSQLRPGLPVLVPQGDVGGGELVSRLAELERPFLPHVVYQNVAPNFEPIEPFPVAAVFVAAPSAARRLIAHYPWIAQAPFLPIGPTTHAALEELGVRRFLGPIEAPGQGVDWRLWTQRRQADILAAAWREHASSIPDDPDFQR